MLTLTDQHCTMGKIANNLEKHGDDDVTAFDIPIALVLHKEQYNVLNADQYSDRAFFNTVRGVEEPADWTRSVTWPLRHAHRYEGASITFVLSDSKEYAFEDCIVDKIQWEPKTGGVLDVTMQVRVRPGSDKQILALMHHQNRPVKVSIAEARIALKRGLQRDLPLNSFGDGEQPEQGASEGERPVSGGFTPSRTAEEIDEQVRAGARQGESTEDTAEFEEAARKQVEAYQAKGGVVDGTTPKSRRRGRAAAH